MEEENKQKRKKEEDESAAAAAVDNCAVAAVAAAAGGMNTVGEPLRWTIFNSLAEGPKGGVSDGMRTMKKKKKKIIVIKIFLVPKPFISLYLESSLFVVLQVNMGKKEHIAGIECKVKRKEKNAIDICA